MSSISKAATAADSLPREKVEQFDRDLSAILRRYPEDRKSAALLPALRLGQELFGHLTPEVQLLAASRLGVSPSRADEVATFYVMFEHPAGGPARGGDVHQRLLLPDRRGARSGSTSRRSWG